VIDSLSIKYENTFFRSGLLERYSKIVPLRTIDWYVDKISSTSFTSKTNFDLKTIMLESDLVLFGWYLYKQENPVDYILIVNFIDEDCLDVFELQRINESLNLVAYRSAQKKVDLIHSFEKCNEDQTETNDFYAYLNIAYLKLKDDKIRIFTYLKQGVEGKSLINLVEKEEHKKKLTLKKFLSR
jgi:hypothetical protein